MPECLQTSVTSLFTVPLVRATESVSAPAVIAAVGAVPLSTNAVAWIAPYGTVTVSAEALYWNFEKLHFAP